VATDPQIKLISENKKARFDFELEETYEAGIQLTGSEVKSIRAGSVNLKDSYVAFQGEEAFLQNAHISVYRASSYNNHAPERLRKLLLSRAEIDEIKRAVVEKGYTCVPTKIYLKKGWIKLEIALGIGRKKGDKRELLKERSIKKDLQNQMRKDS
jgi:SsrA-binding protein